MAKTLFSALQVFNGNQPEMGEIMETTMTMMMAGMTKVLYKILIKGNGKTRKMMMIPDSSSHFAKNPPEFWWWWQLLWSQCLPSFYGQFSSPVGVVPNWSH
jgi:hypothetical protein